MFLDKNIGDKKMETALRRRRIHLFVTNLFVKSCIVHLVCKTPIRRGPDMPVVVDSRKRQWNMIKSAFRPFSRQNPIEGLSVSTKRLLTKKWKQHCERRRIHLFVTNLFV